AGGAGPGPRRIAPVPPGGVTVVDRASREFRSYVELYERASLLELGSVADQARWRLHPKNEVTYIIDRNINYTNVCVADCKFCAFYRRPKHAEGYVLSFEEIGRKIDELKALGGVQILIQGGHKSEEHTSELQSRGHLVCRLLLEKKKIKTQKVL